MSTKLKHFLQLSEPGLFTHSTALTFKSVKKTKRESGNHVMLTVFKCNAEKVFWSVYGTLIPISILAGRWRNTFFG